MSLSYIIELASNLFSSAINGSLISDNSTSLITGTVVTMSLLSVKKIYENLSTTHRFKIKGEEIRMQRDAKVERYLKEIENKINHERVIQIVSLDATTLLKKIKAKEISVVESYLAFSFRAATVGKEYGLITDVDFVNGLKKAQELQLLIDADDTEELAKYPLIGLPISIKDNMAMKGLISSVGYTTFGQNICKEDALIVSLLRKKGAIPFVHSNVPQALLALDSSNFLWGRCDNPWNRDKISGGSSGGEGGLVISRCSAVGLGSDIGGSIRIPSVLNGLYGFKPTSTRISRHGDLNYTGTNFLGFVNILPSYGPICKSADDVILMTKNLFGEFSQDYYVDNKPFDNESFNKKIVPKQNKIGYFHETTLTESSHSVQSAVNEVADLLRKQGFEVVQFPIDRFNTLIELGLLLLINSGCVEHVLKATKGEPIYYYYQKYFFLWKQPRWIISLLSKIAYSVGEKRASQFLHNFRKLDRFEFLEAARKYNELKSEFLNYWLSEGYSALISPVLPLTSISHGNASDLMNFNPFNFICNFLDLPSCTIPIRLNEVTSFSSKFKDQFSKLFEKESTESLGMPLGIQVYGLPMQDEFVLNLMKDISSNFEFEKKSGNKIFDVIAEETSKQKK